MDAPNCNMFAVNTSILKPIDTFPAETLRFIDVLLYRQIVQLNNLIIYHGMPTSFMVVSDTTYGIMKTD